MTTKTKIKNPKRAFKAIRKMRKQLIPYTNTNGTITYLNPIKYLMLNRSYTFPEYQKAMVEYARQQFRMQKQKETYSEVDKETKKEDN